MKGISRRQRNTLVFLGKILLIACFYNGCGTDGKLTGNLDSDSQNPAPGNPNQPFNDTGILAFSTNPSATLVAGEAFATPPTVRLYATSGNVQTNSVALVTLTAFTNGSCSQPASGALSSNQSSPTLGEITFAQTNYTKAETIFLRASANGYASVCTGPINVGPASAAKLVFQTQSSAASFPASSFAVQPIVAFLDAYDNSVTNATATVAVAAYTDSLCTTAAPAGILSNPIPIGIAAVSGLAKFGGLSYNSAGTYYLRASSAGLASACSNAVTVSGSLYQDITAASGLGDTTAMNPAAGGYSEAAFTDVNNDGKVDLVFHGLGGVPQLYRNNGANSFLAPQQLGSGQRQIMFGDINNDGSRDFFTSGGVPTFSLFTNNNGVFTDISAGAGIVNGNVDGGAFLDFNKDSLLDIFLPDGRGAGGSSMGLLRNNGNGTFTDVTAAAGLPVGAAMNGFDNPDNVVAIDYDVDGDVDVFVGVSQDSSVGTARILKLFRNNGNATFTDYSAVSGVSGILWDAKPGLSFGDCDNDGDFDMFVGKNIGLVASQLWRNNGNGTFTNVSVASGIGAVSMNAYGSTWGDMDNDGDVDLVVVNAGDGVAASPNVIFRNNGDGTFAQVQTQFNAADVAIDKQSTGVALADTDNDGDLEMFVANFGASSTKFYQNNINNNSFLRVRVVGKGIAGGAPKDGTGSVVQVFDSTGTILRAVRQVSSGDMYGQNEPIVHFGLSGNWGAEFGPYVVKVKYTSGLVKTVNNVVPKNSALTIGNSTLKNTIEVSE